MSKLIKTHAVMIRDLVNHHSNNINSRDDREQIEREIKEDCKECLPKPNSDTNATVHTLPHLNGKYRE